MPFNPSHDTLRRAQGGDAQALDELIALIQPPLYRFSVKMCGTPEDAEEVLQDTLITVARSVQDFRGASSFSTWAYTIARNFCLKRRRKSKFAPTEEESLDQLDWQHNERLISTEPNPEEDVADLELWKQLRAGIQRIEPDYREILVLRDIEGLSAKEVAEVVELSVPAVKSRLHRARGQLRGHLESGPDVVRDLAFVVRELNLDERLGQTLDELNALDLQTWASLAPEGNVDLVVREQFGGAIGPASDLDLVVQLVDVRSSARMLPRPAEKMTGELRIKNGELSFRDIRAELGGATVHCSNGLVRKRAGGDDRTEIAFDVLARDFPIDDGLANLFTGPLREAVLQRQLRGVADVDGLSLRFLLPGADSELPFATTIRGSIGLDGVDVLLGRGREGLQIQNLHGQVVLAESTVDDAGGRLVGTLDNGAMTILGQPFEAVESTFTADATQLLVHTLRTRLHDGELRHQRAEAPALTYTFSSPAAPEGRLAAGLQFDRIDVYSLLAASGWANPPYRGLASGQIDLLHLDGNNLVGAEATGALSVREADLGRVPLFKAIYAQLPPADQPRFHRLDTEFRLTEKALQLDRLDVRSDILAVQGGGALTLDGYLDVQMKLDGLLGDSADPLLMPFLNYVAKNLISFRLFGNLRDLRASTEFLGARTPRRPPTLPMPPARARPNAPGY